MPQMSPMNWSMLFIYFNTCFFICMNKIFYLSSTVVNKENILTKVYNNFSYVI